jgi:hypothetical protein
MTHPPPSSGSAIADEEVWRPLPIALTRPVARSAEGTSALISVDLPTPEWPTSTEIWSCSRSRTSSSGPPRWVTTAGTDRAE